jgi:uncharacterized membrane protein
VFDGGGLNSMTAILLAASFFVGIHLLVAGTRLRDGIVRAIGERPYLGLFSLLSLAGIVWLSHSFARSEPMAPLWQLPMLRWVALVGTFVAFEFAVIGLTTPNPTSVGADAVLDSQEPARGMLRVTRHPFLWGVALWGLCHVLVNPDPPALLFFGALLALALMGPLSIDAKRRRVHGVRWERFAAVTSNVPFAAIFEGRNRLAIREIGAWRVALGLGLYLGVLAAHVWLFGASPMP